MEALELSTQNLAFILYIVGNNKKFFKANKVRVVFLKCETMCVFVIVVSL